MEWEGPAGGARGTEDAPSRLFTSLLREANPIEHHTFHFITISVIVKPCIPTLSTHTRGNGYARSPATLIHSLDADAERRSSGAGNFMLEDKGPTAL